MDTLQECRELLEQLTPLHTDCGLYCGHLCCASHEGEETGMLLFPGEEQYYASLPEWKVTDTGAGKLLVCPGSCDRRMRPLSCRIFPLLPLLRQDGVKVATDARAAGTCPLRRDDLCDEFRDAVKQCGRLLAQDPLQRPFLEQLTRMHDELKQLRNTFRG